VGAPFILSQPAAATRQLETGTGADAGVVGAARAAMLAAAGPAGQA
jgi:hypothetical protein